MTGTVVLSCHPARGKGTASLGASPALPPPRRALPGQGNAGRDEANEVCAEYGWEANRFESSENTQMAFRMLLLKISSSEFVIARTLSAPGWPRWWIAVPGVLPGSPVPAAPSAALLAGARAASEEGTEPHTGSVEAVFFWHRPSVMHCIAAWRSWQESNGIYFVAGWIWSAHSAPLVFMEESSSALDRQHPRSLKAQVCLRNHFSEPILRPGLCL